jgi:hypothetical protein
METRVNFRITKDGEIIAVFIEKLMNGKFLVYSLYDNMHFEADDTFIRECKLAKGYNSSELLAYLKNRGYENIKILSRMKF